MTKRWCAETVSGGPEYLAAALQRVQDVHRGEVFCVLTNPGPYTSWTVVWTVEEQSSARRAAAAEELAGAAV
jgi:hypothetical protein